MNEWLQVLAILIGNAGIIYMFRKENRDDTSQIRGELREDQKHLDNRWYAAIKSIEMECKDFHERLLEIERSKKEKLK